MPSAFPSVAADSTCFTDVLRIEPAAGLYELAYSARQDAVFVASSGGFADDAPPSCLLRLDAATLAVQARIPLPHKGFGVALDDAADRLYIGHGLDASASVVDTAVNVLLDTLQLAEKAVGEDGEAVAPFHLRQLLVDPARGRLYLPGLAFGGSVLFVVDTATFALVATVEGLGPIATGLALNDNGRRLFVANFAGEIVTVDTTTLTIAHRVATGAEQPLNFVWASASQCLWTTDQGMAQVRDMQVEHLPGFASRHPGNRLALIDPVSGAIVESLNTGAGPIAVLADAARGRLYVTTRDGGTLDVFDSASRALIDTVDLKPHPNSLALDAACGVVYASVKQPHRAGGNPAEQVVRLG